MQRVSGLRWARSCLSPKNEVASAELNFQLAVRGGIEIAIVYGFVTDITDEAADVAVGAPKEAMQSLHMETDALEDLPISDAEDAYNVDTEAFFQQGLVWHGVEDDTNGHSSIGLWLAPNAPVNYPEGQQVSARNITHRAESADADLTVVFHVAIGYYYVELTLSEMGLFLSRRI